MLACTPFCVRAPSCVSVYMCPRPCICLCVDCIGVLYCLHECLNSYVRSPCFIPQITIENRLHVILYKLLSTFLWGSL